VLPPSLHFERPNPGIDFARTPFYVNTELRPWPPTAWPRRAGISSFGVGGTNAHLVLEEAPAARSSPGRTHSLLVLSARTDAALAAMSARLADALEADPATSLEDVAYTLQVGRKVFERRRAIVGASRAEAIEALRRAPAAPDAATSERGDPPVVFMFPGQGAQYPNMGRELYDTEQVFRDTIDECADHLRAGGHLGEDLRAALYPRAGDEAEAAARLTETSVSQPAILAVEVALARLLMRWGIAPMAVLGHSVGELAAACVAGVFSLETAVKAVAARGRLMQAQPPGRMLAVRMPAAELEALLSPELALAAVNAPQLSVASGPAPAVEALQSLLAGRGVAASPLRTSHAFHSAMMEPAVPALTAEVARLTLAAPTIPVFSTVLGRPLTAHEATDPAYWGRQLRATVRFADALAAAAEPGRLFLEVGPGQTLQQLARQTAVSAGGRNVLSCLGPLQAPGSDVAQVLAAVGRLWVAGKPVHFEDLAHGDRRRVPLPTYPFERKRFWVDPAPARPDPSSAPSGSRPGPATRPPAPTPPAQAPAIPAPVGASGQSGRTQDLIRHQLDIMAEQLALVGRGRETRRKD
jgi:acyl transferase domain-containing protein